MEAEVTGALVEYKREVAIELRRRVSATMGVGDYVEDFIKQWSNFVERDYQEGRTPAQAAEGLLSIRG